jgi:CheY-like chemotaxis protein
MLNARGSRKLRVLIVDDYPVARRIFITELKPYGVETFEAGDAAEALAIANEHQPDVVVLDLFLTGSSGLEVARELRARRGGDRIVIIALSGHGGEEYRERAAEAGCDRYLVKPCNTDQLVEAIEAVLPARSAA